MTKAVRIENADTSTFKVRVRIQHRVYDEVNKVYTNEWADTGEVQELPYPAQMSNGLYLTSHRRFIVEEYE